MIYFISRDAHVQNQNGSKFFWLSSGITKINQRVNMNSIVLLTGHRISKDAILYLGMLMFEIEIFENFSGNRAVYGKCHIVTTSKYP